MKKLISLLLAVVMLATLCVSVNAADTVIEPQVLNSITEEDETGLGLAFLYTMNMNDVAIIGNRTFNGAYVGGQKVVKLGAVVSNQEETGTDPNAMVIENTNGIKLLNVEATKLWDGWTATQLQYAVRITNIPTTANKTQVYARPYYILEDGTVVYGAISNKSYFSGWCDAQDPGELPAIGTDIDVAKKKNRIRVSKAEIVDRTVTLTFQNYTSNWITEETDYVRYTCYDADDNILDADLNSTAQYGTIYIGCIDTKKNKIKSFTFDVPDATAKVVLTGSRITYWTEWA